MKMFILVRGDLDPSYRMVQGMHAVSELITACLYHKVIPSSWDKTMVCLIVKDQVELVKWMVKTAGAGPTSAWYEPDLNNQLTAIACFPRNDVIFEKLQLA